MSASIRTAGPSIDKFTRIFNVALTDYERATGTRLDTHPFATQLDSRDHDGPSPETVSNTLRTQAEGFSKFSNENAKLMAWLDSIVHILCTFSSTLVQGIGLSFSPAIPIFTGIGVLFGVAAAARNVAVNCDALLDLFKRIHFSLQRLNLHTGIPLANEMTELLGKIIAELLSAIALSTKAMTDGRIKRFVKRLMGRTDVEKALLRLDTLTAEESSMMAARDLEVTNHVDGNAIATEDATDEPEGTELSEKLRTWLSPPDPSVNHDTACKVRHTGTAGWLIQGSTFREWKRNGSLLWIHGISGAGKSVLCSAIVQDIKNMREVGSALIAYHYFDLNDASKRDIRGLLTSLLFQLADDSNHCWDVLYKLFTVCRDGDEQPSDVDLARCLKDMLELPGQAPIFIIVDALDECPNTAGTPSARKTVLDVVEDLIRSHHPNLFLCITSRPEQDIQAILGPLTPASRRMSLHEEGGQREDITNYVRSFIYTDRAIQRWREEDKVLVVNTLLERAGGVFRWVYCQLDRLRRCFPPSIRKALNELPIALDETYERTLQGIPKEKRQYAHRLFQCLVAAIRPLRVEELTEVLAIEFEAGVTPNLKEDWLSEIPEEVLLSACSTLIAVIEGKSSRVVQFSHPSVKEFFTSDRLRTSEVGNIRHYHIFLDTAHTILARACLALLLQLGENMDKKRLAAFPLALYSARHWVDHAKFGDVASRVQDAMEQLFDPGKPSFAAWVWIFGGCKPRGRQSPGPRRTPLYFAVSFGFSALTRHLAITHAEDVNVECIPYGTPLLMALENGRLDIARVLLAHGADPNLTDSCAVIPLLKAYSRRNLEGMRLLLEHGANADVEFHPWGVLLHHASSHGKVDDARLLLQHNADANARGTSNWTPLHWASRRGHADIVESLLACGADLNATSMTNNTPLFLASEHGHLEVAQLLLRHGANVRIRGRFNCTPFEVATSGGHIGVAQLLEHSTKEE